MSAGLLPGLRIRSKGRAALAVLTSVFCQGSAASFKLSRRSHLYRNVGHSKLRGSSVGKSIRGWVNVREYPSDKKAEESYIRHKDVQRVSIVENEDETVSVLVHALGGTYLVTILETLPEALRQLENLVKEISD